MVLTGPANCGAGGESTLCRVCKKQPAVKFCKNCKDGEKQLCALCVAVHERVENHVAAPLCSECFGAAGRRTCETCQAKLCSACTRPHLEVCGCEDGGEGGGNECGSDHGSEEMLIDLCTSSDDSGDENEDAERSEDGEEDESEEEEEEEQGRDSAAEDEDFDPDGESDDENMTAGDKRRRRAEEAKKNKRQKKAAAKKIAETIGHQEVFNRKPDAVAEVSDDVLRRIRGALKLGLHEGGTQCEKDQAMRLATKLMQSYGLSQADVEKTGKSDIEAAAGMVAVRLNGLFYKWPQWGHTVTSVADCMAGTESFYMKSGAHKDAKKCNEDSMTVTFYGLQSGAEFAAYIFEVAYNTAMEKGELEYGDKGQASKKEDYRDGITYGMLQIAERNKEEREMFLQSARECAEHAARAKTEAGTSKAATGGKAGAANDAAAPGSGEQAGADATKGTEGMPTDAIDTRISDEKMKDAQNLGEVVNGADGASKDAETVATGGVAGGKPAEEIDKDVREENPWCGDDGDGGGYGDGDGDTVDDHDAEHDEQEGENTLETAERDFMSPQERRKAAAAEKKRERERAKAAKAAEREAKKVQKAAEKEEKRKMKEEEKEIKRLAKKREKREKEAARAAKKAEKASKAGKDQQKAAEPVYTDKDIEPEMQQLVLYDDKRQKVIEAVEESLNIEKDRKLKWRKIKDWRAYCKGKKDAEDVHLGAKALPAPAGSDKEAAKGKKRPSDKADVKKEPVVKVEHDNGGEKRPSDKADVKKEPVVKVEHDNGGENSTKVEDVKDETLVKPEPVDAVA